MRLSLERLEDRITPDAVVAQAFLTYLAPQMYQSVELMAQGAMALANRITTVATAEATVMGPQFAATNLPQVYGAAAALVSSLPALQSAVSAEIMADYTLLLASPYSSGELRSIMSTVVVIEQIDVVLPNFGA